MFMTSTISEDHIQKDILLIEKISEQDHSAFSELYDRHSTLLYSVILRILKEKQEAEDALQEVFVNIWDRAELYDDRLGNPVAWLCRVARNKAVDRVRSKNFRTRTQESNIENYHDLFAADINDTPDRRAMLSSQQEDIFIALTSLPSEQKELVEFAYFRGYTQSELAEYFNIPLGTVKTRIRSAMTALRQKLRHHFI